MAADCLASESAKLEVKRVIEKLPYYHGLLPREDVRLILKDNGDFVIRISEPKVGEARQYILSVLNDKTADEVNSMKHVIIKHAKNKFWVDKISFDSIKALIDFYLSPTGHAAEQTFRLVRPIPRQTWELEHEWIVIQKKLGEGAFGEVSAGVFKYKGRDVQVAVKQAKLEKLGKEQIKEFMGEARFMRTISHPNIVKFYGVAVIQEPLYMVMELASDGALDSYLKKHPTLPLDTRNEMILQAAWGLEYLHLQPVLHRDIAARNCLYGDKKVKISDFGLSRKGTNYQMDPKKKVPIRWLAIETLTSAKYSLKTDVWAYGVMCWEIYTGAREPYEGWTPVEVNQKVREGKRLVVPEGVHKEIKEMVESCWKENPNDRPTMINITNILQKVTGIVRPKTSGAENKEHKDQKNLKDPKDQKDQKDPPPPRATTPGSRRRRSASKKTRKVTPTPSAMTPR